MNPRSLRLLALLLTGAMAHAHALDWRTPWSEPQDAVAARDHSDEYAWRLFVALNWPADPLARRADRAAHFGDDKPVVWESWQNATAVYRPDGTDPGPWAKGGVAPRPATAERFETVSLKDVPNARHVVHGVMVPWVDPLESAKRLSEIRMNRAAFEFIRAHDLYSIDGQLRAIAAGQVRFPYGVKEVKAKWRPINEAERARYHTLTVTLADGTQRLYGLTALHIASKDLPNWFWATFEHVDNPALPDGEHWLLASHDDFACRDGAADCNRPPPHIGLEGTVWEYYRLRGSLTSFTDPSGAARRLANSELEAGFQTTASCMTCHARASIAWRPGTLDDGTIEALRLPIFDGPGRRGFIGMPQAAWYAPAVADPGTVPARFVPLDFVWSLGLARRRNTPSADP